MRNALEGGIRLKLVFLTLTFPYIILKFKKVQNIVQLGSQCSFYNHQKRYRNISRIYIFLERANVEKINSSQLKLKFSIIICVQREKIVQKEKQIMKTFYLK